METLGTIAGWIFYGAGWLYGSAKNMVIIAVLAPIAAVVWAYRKITN